MSEQVIVKGKTSFVNDEVEQLQDVSCGIHMQEFIGYQKANAVLNDEGSLNLRNSSCDILNYCNPHDAVNNDPTTHLVVGYVQSGKTMSFTSLIELALDNHYKVVVILAGITTNLLNQTDDRLGEDLVCGNPKNYKHFKIQKNPGKNNVSEIARNLKLNDSVLVINVLKHAGRIRNVAEIFKDEEIKRILSNETVLIVDDEADQASLNNFGRANSRVTQEEAERMSSTYEAILTLRNQLPGNSYVQYTATPQANILINTVDMLSPKTHTLLTPGKGYCGGKLFFGVGEEGERFGQSLIKVIPEDEVFNARRNALEEIPESLKFALMLHIWAVIINTRHYEHVVQLSMMVHADATLHWNSIFFNWINAILKEWSDIYDSAEYGVRRFKLDEEFKKAYLEATRLYQEDSALVYQSLKKFIPEVLNDTRVYLITGETNDVDELDWNQYSSNILVGAQMLNRGFTVKNLTTTYMPRYTLTQTNADTIEQRCRFFGYKEKYIRSCRVFLPQISIDNYLNYIKSEEELRSIMAKTKSLEQCGHKILSFPNLRPTRANVLPASVVSTNLVGMKEFSPYDNFTIMKRNIGIIDAFIDEFKSSTHPFKRFQYDYSKYDQKGDRVHTSFRVTVEEAVAFLKSLQFGNTADFLAKGDTVRYLLYLKESGFISDVEVVNMSEGKFKSRKINLDTKKLTTNLFNGPSNAKDKNTYIGDRCIYVDDTITIQLHHLKIENIPGVIAGSIAIYYPSELSVQYVSTI